MITGIIAGVFLLAMYGCACNGSWGAVAVGAVIVILLLAIGSASREQAKAANNFIDYWAKGGPDRKR